MVKAKIVFIVSATSVINSDKGKIKFKTLGLAKKAAIRLSLKTKKEHFIHRRLISKTRDHADVIGVVSKKGKFTKGLF